MNGLPKSLQTPDSPIFLQVSEFSSQSEAEASIPLSIVSNSVLLREGLQLLLPPCLKVQFVGSYSGSLLKSELNGSNLVRQVALVDSNLGRETIFEWIHYWKGLAVPALVIILEITDDPELIFNYIEAGANGYVPQGATTPEVAETIRAVYLGRAYCSPEMTAYLFARLAARPPTLARPNVLLTTREKEVLRYIEANYNNQQIAEVLVIETLTVKHHVHNILTKLKAAHRHEAARIAREQGWLTRNREIRLE